MKESSLTRGLKSVGRWAASELMPTLPTSRSFQFGMNSGVGHGHNQPGDRWTEQKLGDLISRFQENRCFEAARKEMTAFILEDQGRYIKTHPGTACKYAEMCHLFTEELIRRNRVSPQDCPGGMSLLIVAVRKLQKNVGGAVNGEVCIFLYTHNLLGKDRFHFLISHFFGGILSCNDLKSPV